jgi:hypothetical protein
MSAALEYEWELEGEAFAPVGPALAPATLQQIGARAARVALSQGLPALREAEYEGEYEWEAMARGPERAINPIRRVYPDAMMEHLAHAAAEAESEAEAEAFIGALVPIAARLIPRIAPTIMRAAPGLVRGIAGVTRTLRRNPATRPLVRAVPTILRRTTADIARQARRGPVTPQQAVSALARQSRRVLCSPQQTRHALRHNAALDRRYHQAAAARRRPMIVR